MARSHSLSKNSNLCTAVLLMQGELEGAKPTSNRIKMPCKALRSKACRERREDFYVAQQHKNLALFQAVKKVRTDFFDRLRDLATTARSHLFIRNFDCSHQIRRVW